VKRTNHTEGRRAVELDEAACRAHPGGQNVGLVSPTVLDAGYVQARARRRRLIGREG